MSTPCALAFVLLATTLPACARPAPHPARAAAAPANAPAPEDPRAALGRVVDPVFAEYAKPDSAGCAVGVYRAGEVAFTNGYGQASLEHGVPITERTRFDIGSVSKQFTATAILLLAKDGKLSLDDDVRKYVPEVPDYGHVITLRQLLHHTSGLRDYTNLLALAGYDDADVTNDDDALWVIAHQKATTFLPGSQYAYSNTGYFLLSRVVLAVTGDTLATFAKARIFEPLGMRDTFILDHHADVVPRKATAYAARDGGGYDVATSDFEQTGDGAVQTTVVDLARWDASFYDPKAFGDDWLRAMRTPGKLADGTALDYAMGLEIGETNGVAREEHGGAWAGFRAHIVRFPSERLAVAVLCNVAESDPGGLADAVVAKLAPKLAASDDEGEPEDADAAAPRAQLAAADLAAAAGTYVDTDAGELRVLRVEGGELRMAFAPGGGRTRTLDPIDAHHFAVRGASARYELAPATPTEPPRLTRVVEGSRQTFERVERGGASATELAACAGRYGSEEIPRDVELRVQGGALHMGIWGRSFSGTLSPIGRDTFVIDEGGGVVRFERDAPGGRVRRMTTFLPRAGGIGWTKRE